MLFYIRFAVLARLMIVAAHGVAFRFQKQASGGIHRRRNAAHVFVAVEDIQLAQANRPLVLHEFNLVIFQMKDVLEFKLVHADQFFGFVLHVLFVAFLVVAELVNDTCLWKAFAQSLQKEFGLANFVREVP